MSKLYCIGHPAYQGANRAATHARYSLALRDLISRGVPMRAAHIALKSALAGSHSTCSTMRNSRRTHVVEVTIRPAA